MKRSVGKGLVPSASALWLVAALALLSISGGCNSEVGTVDLPKVKDRTEILPGGDSAAKSPFQKGAVLKKSTAPKDEGKAPLNPKL